jgi:hypothetical protein
VTVIRHESIRITHALKDCSTWFSIEVMVPTLMRDPAIASITAHNIKKTLSPAEAREIGEAFIAAADEAQQKQRDLQVAREGA